ncbi:hypothetical protein EJ08DRAFT_713949 [Tothia fuscella]|uniref:Uncharacterized protein n=1 Tax=Tothia fuscella TaxID=1048955 RepID=A0A9P4NTJ3_9PEZI|nr:hypothetical protein EJ08DRAFT_713949 [Tothia fuscella]
MATTIITTMEHSLLLSLLLCWLASTLLPSFSPPLLSPFSWAALPFLLSAIITIIISAKRTPLLTTISAMSANATGYRSNAQLRDIISQLHSDLAVIKGWYDQVCGDKQTLACQVMELEEQLKEKSLESEWRLESLTRYSKRCRVAELEVRNLTWKNASLGDAVKHHDGMFDKMEETEKWGEFMKEVAGLERKAAKETKEACKAKIVRFGKWLESMAEARIEKLEGQVGKMGATIADQNRIIQDLRRAVRVAARSAPGAPISAAGGLSTPAVVSAPQPVVSAPLPVLSAPLPSGPDRPKLQPKSRLARLPPAALAEEEEDPLAGVPFSPFVDNDPYFGYFDNFAGEIEGDVVGGDAVGDVGGDVVGEEVDWSSLEQTYEASKARDDAAAAAANNSGASTPLDSVSEYSEGNGVPNGGRAQDFDY